MIDTCAARMLVCFVLLAGAPGASAHDGHQESPGSQSAGSMVAGPSTDYAFPLAEPGTYRLPAIKPAAGGGVLDELGRGHDLAELMRGRISILAFIYTRCGDVCPTASLRLSQLQDLAAGNPGIARRLRLVSMSFDPEHDTPDVMADYAGHWRSVDPNAPEWLYVTTVDQKQLQPILAAYDQPVMPKTEPSSTGPLAHILRVFLIDPSGQVRNIYSLDFLDPELVLNDIRTLILDEEQHDRRMSPTR
ncbi:SCO family protein [Microvirga sp. TS319]|uniref:SCO family protein n=1 Tax=Microvirga sp. TS319 TaxID=3241165 RepID=UPI00351A3C01